MKKISLFVVFLFLIAPTVFAEDGWPGATFPRCQKDEKPETLCPKTRMTEGCISCHVTPTFQIKEFAPDVALNYPSMGFRFLNYPENPIGYYSIGEIDSNESEKIDKFIEYMKRHKVKHFILDVHSYGGTIFDAWKIKGLLSEFENEGGIVETRVRGMALSAGFIIFCAGTKGYRVANPESELMLHELAIFKGGLFYIEKVSPSSAEEEAAVLRHLQRTISNWLATRGKISSEDLMAKVKNKEFWISGREAYEWGFADKLMETQ